MLYTSFIKDHFLKIDSLYQEKLCGFNWPFIPYNESLITFILFKKTGGGGGGDC